MSYEASRAMCDYCGNFLEHDESIVCMACFQEVQQEKQREIERLQKEVQRLRLDCAPTIPSGRIITSRAGPNQKGTNSGTDE